MGRFRFSALLGVVLLMSGVAAWRVFRAASPDISPDRDGDGLNDRVEAFFAEHYLPTVHEFVTGADRDECLMPETRPILYRARPYTAGRRDDQKAVAITYVLLYAEDCGALGHRG